MPENLYSVRIAKSAELLRFGYRHLLVQLVCYDHRQKTKDREANARQLARDAMVDKYGPGDDIDKES
jgi:hypothetical protein